MNINKDQRTKQIFQQLIELICYIIVSARNLLQESKLYGPLRMIEVAGKLTDILSCEGLDFPLLPVFREHIETAIDSVVEGEASFVANLDSLVSDVISILANIQKEGTL